MALLYVRISIEKLSLLHCLILARCGEIMTQQFHRESDTCPQTLPKAQKLYQNMVIIPILPPPKSHKILTHYIIN